MRVLTKLMKSPLERWRSKGMKVFIHVDDGLGIVRGRSEALEASRTVRKELGRYGLLASEEKLAWGARQSLVWTGFLRDTRKFKLYVMEDKLKRVELLLEEILEQRFMKVRKLARVAGMVGSFYLAMGDMMTRFHTRGMMSQIWME